MWRKDDLILCTVWNSLQYCLSGVRDVRLPSLPPPVCVTLLMSWWVVLTLYPPPDTSHTHTHTVQVQTHRLHVSLMVGMWFSRLEDCVSLTTAPPPMWIPVSTLISWWVSFSSLTCSLHLCLFWCILICVFCSVLLAEVQCPVGLVHPKPVLLVCSLLCNYISDFILEKYYFSWSLEVSSVVVVTQEDIWDFRMLCCSFIVIVVIVIAVTTAKMHLINRHMWCKYAKSVGF